MDGRQIVDGAVRGALEGTVDVTGTARTGAPGTPGGSAPLHADAGDSAYVVAGEKAVLPPRSPSPVAGRSSPSTSRRPGTPSRVSS